MTNAEERKKEYDGKYWKIEFHIKEVDEGEKQETAGKWSQREQEFKKQNNFHVTSNICFGGETLV